MAYKFHLLVGVFIYYLNLYINLFNYLLFASDYLSTRNVTEMFVQVQA